MRSRYRVFDSAVSHFVTGTIVGWLPVFTNAARCDILVQAFHYCRAHKELKVYAWVILDTHFHAIIAAPDLTRVLADLKRHTARRIVEQLQAERSEWLDCESSVRLTRSRANTSCGKRDRIRRRSKPTR
jgi:REP-associated tyrosine transposase